MEPRAPVRVGSGILLVLAGITAGVGITRLAQLHIAHVLVAMLSGDATEGLQCKRPELTPVRLHH